MTRTRKKLINAALLLIIAFAVFQYAKTLSFIISAASTHGRISDIRKQWQCYRDQNTQREHCDWQHSPIFTFHDHNGQNHTIRSPISSSGDSNYSLGEQIRVLYNKQYPDNAKINNFSELWFMPLFFSIWSLIVAIAYLIWHKKETKETPENIIRPAWLVNIVKASLLLPLVILISARIFST